MARMTAQPLLSDQPARKRRNSVKVKKATCKKCATPDDSSSLAGKYSWTELHWLGKTCPLGCVLRNGDHGDLFFPRVWLDTLIRELGIDMEQLKAAVENSATSHRVACPLHIMTDGEAAIFNQIEKDLLPESWPLSYFVPGNLLMSYARICALLELLRGRENWPLRRPSTAVVAVQGVALPAILVTLTIVDNGIERGADAILVPVKVAEECVESRRSGHDMIYIRVETLPDHINFLNAFGAVSGIHEIQSGTEWVELNELGEHDHRGLGVRFLLEDSKVLESPKGVRLPNGEWLTESHLVLLSRTNMMKSSQPCQPPQAAAAAGAEVLEPPHEQSVAHPPRSSLDVQSVCGRKMTVIRRGSCSEPMVLADLAVAVLFPDTSMSVDMFLHILRQLTSNDFSVKELAPFERHLLSECYGELIERWINGRKLFLVKKSSLESHITNVAQIFENYKSCVRPRLS